jgi:hypothetical protein
MVKEVFLVENFTHKSFSMQFDKMNKTFNPKCKRKQILTIKYKIINH